MSIDESQVTAAVGGVVDPELRAAARGAGHGRPVQVRRQRVDVEVGAARGPLPPGRRADAPGAPGGRARCRASTRSPSTGRSWTRSPGPGSGSLLRGEPVEGGTSTAGRRPRPRRTARPLGHEEGRPNRFMLPRSKTRILGISSGKGGVGKSSVTVNLAVALARMGHDVGILDADVYGFSVPEMLGVTADPLIIGDLVVPPTANGVRCLSMGFFVPDDTPVIWRGPMLHKALEQFLVDAYWGEPDFLLIDMPPGHRRRHPVARPVPDQDRGRTSSPRRSRRPSGWPSDRPTPPAS